MVAHETLPSHASVISAVTTLKLVIVGHQGYQRGAVVVLVDFVEPFLGF